MNSITYILTSEGADYCVLIDCGCSDELIPAIEKIGKSVKAVFLTHAHYDHIYGLNMLYGQYPDALVYTNEEGREALTDPKKNFSKYHPDIVPFVYEHPENVRLLEDGEVELFDGEKMQVLFTPGHDVSCFCFMMSNNLFTGDAYIPGIKTVMTFPRSNRKDALVSQERLKVLEREGYIVRPGHDISQIKTYDNQF